MCSSSTAAAARKGRLRGVSCARAHSSVSTGARACRRPAAWCDSRVAQLARILARDGNQAFLDRSRPRATRRFCAGDVQLSAGPGRSRAAAASGSSSAGRGSAASREGSSPLPLCGARSSGASPTWRATAPKPRPPIAHVRQAGGRHDRRELAGSREGGHRRRQVAVRRWVTGHHAPEQRHHAAHPETMGPRPTPSAVVDSRHTTRPPGRVTRAISRNASGTSGTLARPTRR